MLIRVTIATALFLGTTALARSQAIPKEIWGKWKIVRELPTKTISCWGDPEAKKLIGTRIEYSDKVFRWDKVRVDNPTVDEDKLVTARELQKVNSSPSTNGSQVDFRQLGMTAKDARKISIHHAPANITGGTVEVPGDNLLLKDQETIIFSVCNIYFEAKRIHEKK